MFSHSRQVCRCQASDPLSSLPAGADGCRPVRVDFRPELRALIQDALARTSPGLSRRQRLSRALSLQMHPLHPAEPPALTPVARNRSNPWWMALEPFLKEEE